MNERWRQTLFILDYDYYFRTSILYPCCVRPSVLTMYCYNVGTTADHSCIHVIYLLIWTTYDLTTTLILFTKYQTFAVALATHFAVIDKSQLILR